MPRLHPDNCPTNALSCIVQITRSGEFVAFQSCCAFHQALRDAGTPDAVVANSIHAAMGVVGAATETVARVFGLTKAGGASSASRVPFVSLGYILAGYPLPPVPYIRADADGGYTVVSGRSAAALTVLRAAVVADIANGPMTIARNAPASLLRVVR